MASRNQGQIVLSWDDPVEAEAVAQVLMDAALDKKGMVRDHGFYDDAESIFKQADEMRREEAAWEAEA